MSEFVIRQFMASSGANGRDGSINTITTELEVISEMLRISGSKVELPSLSYPDGLVIDFEGAQKDPRSVPRQRCIAACQCRAVDGQ
jgi:hypothetical protein